MIVRVEAPFLAPVPVGNRVTVIAIEMYVTPISLFGPTPAGSWQPSTELIVCDETTRIVYADLAAGLHPEASYESLRFTDESRRVSQSRAPLRGRVIACVAVSDRGDIVQLRTRLAIEPDPPGAVFR